jgi:hypothetical protein
MNAVICLASLSSCYVHLGCVLFVVEWRRRVKWGVFPCTCVHTLFEKKKKKKIAPVIRVVVVTRWSLHMVSEPVQPTTWDSLWLSLA